jgi:hypothetical protein
LAVFKALAAALVDNPRQLIYSMTLDSLVMPPTPAVVVLGTRELSALGASGLAAWSTDFTYAPQINTPSRSARAISPFQWVFISGRSGRFLNRLLLFLIGLSLLGEKLEPTEPALARFSADILGAVGAFLQSWGDRRGRELVAAVVTELRFPFMVRAA